MTIPDCAAIREVTRVGTDANQGLSRSRPIGKVTGSRHLGAAFGYSLGGALRLLKETAFRHEIVAGLVLLVLLAVVGAHPSDYAVMISLMLGLVAIEALNTAIEEIVDRISPEWSTSGKHAKDLGSFAVFCMLAANGLMAGFIILSRLVAP